MNAKSKDALIATGRATMSPSYNPQPLVLDRGEGVRVTTWTERVPRLLGRDRGRHARPLAPRSGGGAAGTGRAPRPREQRVLDRPQILLQEALTTRPSRTACSSATLEQRRTRRRSSSRVATSARSGRRASRSSRSRSPSTGGPTRRSTRRLGPSTTTASSRWCLARPRRPSVTSRRSRRGSRRTPPRSWWSRSGQGGVRPAPGLPRRVRALCDAHGLVLIFDEVQYGVGRTGHWFGYQDAGVVPDAMSLARSGRRAARRDGCDRGGLQGFCTAAATTYRGTLRHALGLVVLETIEREGLLENARARGEQLPPCFGWLDRFAEVEDVAVAVS